MSILVINSGSSSVKYKLFENEKEIKAENVVVDNNHNQVIKKILRQIGNMSELEAVGHRVVHGGEEFYQPTIINDEIITKLEQYNDLAPLHNPYNLAGVKAVRDYLENITQVAVFDTAFYYHLPEIAKLYALPLALSRNYKIRRYGFHGISHQYVLEEAAKNLQKDKNKINLISCHLGGGWSITAVKAGQPIETSMGWTPLEGLVMMTRSGDLDPGIVLKLLKILPGEINQDKVDQLYDLLNNHSGIKGLSGMADFQELLHDVSLGNDQAKFTFELCLNRLVKYIGGYFVSLEGKVDAIVFTGAIGAGNPMTRNAVIKKIKCLGDIPTLAIKTNEELMIAREVTRILLL